MSDRIINPLTGRSIKKNSRTHKTLIKAGIIREKGRKINIDKSDSEDYESEESNSDSALLEENKEEKYEYDSESSSSSGSDLKNDLNDTFNIEDIDNMNVKELAQFHEYLKKYKK